MSSEQSTIKSNYLYSLEFKGINCFKDSQILDLSNGDKDYSQWTIILGDNGTGKTTLLRLLYSMQSVPRSLNEKTYISPNNEYLKFTNPHTYNSVKLSLVCNNELISYSYERLTHTYTLWGDDGYFFIISYGASRRMSKNPNIYEKDDSKSKGSSLFDDSIELINAEEWFLQKELIAEKAEVSVKKKFRNQFQWVKSILIDVLPDVEDIRVKPINERNSRLLLEVLTPYGWVNLRDLSHGYQTLTALIVDIAARLMDKYPDSESPLEEAVVILIDEIDLHLHPKWQRTVLDKLSDYFPKAQFIVTSHSPLIVQAAQDKGANIVVCRKEGDKVVIDNNPDEVKGWRVDQILVSDLFEIDGSHSPEVQNLINEKRNILSKKELSNEDEERLQFINKFMDDIPNASDKKAMTAEEIIKKAAELLKK